MVWFILLLILLVIAIAFFITYPIVKRLVLPEKFNVFCERIIRRFAKRNKYHLVNESRLLNFDSKQLKIDHVLFGKKYIYIIHDACLMGEVKGSLEDSSWLYKKYGERVSNYVDNLVDVSNENIRDFAGIIGVNAEIIVAICIIPNECDFQIKGTNSTNVNVVHFSSVKRLIKNLESQNIGELNQERLDESYKTLKEKNE